MAKPTARADQHRHKHQQQRRVDGKGILIGMLSALLGGRGSAHLRLGLFPPVHESGTDHPDRIGRPGEYDDEQALARRGGCAGGDG
jgi:hypothetical protein